MPPQPSCWRISNNILNTFIDTWCMVDLGLSWHRMICIYDSRSVPKEWSKVCLHAAKLDREHREAWSWDYQSKRWRTAENTLAWELHLEEAGVSTDRPWFCVAHVYHSPQPLFYCRVQHANRCIRSTMVFPERVQSLRLSKWACQGGEYHLMFTHDQNRVLQWVLTRLPL